MRKENRNWKLIIGLILGLLMLLLWPIIAFGEEAQWELGFSGYSQETFNFSSDELNNDRTRLKFTLDSDESPCGLVVEVDISGAQDSWNALESSSWLQKGWVQCTASETVAVEAGYIFPVTGLWTFWPGGIKTARYKGAHWPWEGYGALGANLKHAGPVWTHMLTVSGRSDLPFNDGKQFERLEFGVRSLRSFGETRVGFSAQVSEDFAHAGVDFKRHFGDLNVDAGVFWSDADSSPLSAFGQVEWLLPRDFAFHALFQEQVDGDEAVTAGVGYRWKGIYLVGDYEQNLDNGEGAFLVSVRINC